jgi:hypothetical protein
MTSSVIAAPGPDNSLMFYWQTLHAGGWHPEQVAGPNTTFDAPSLAQVGNSAAIVAQDRDLSLAFYWQTIGTAPWHPEQVAKPSPNISFFKPSIAQVG